MRWNFPYSIKYEADARSIDDVIASLTAQKKLIEEGATAISHLAGIELNKVEIRVQQVRAGSLLNEFAVEIYGAYQTEISKTIVGGYEHMFGTDIPEAWEPLVTLGTLAVTYFVARFAYEAVRGRRGDKAPSTHIEGDYNVVINAIASKLHISAEQVENELQGQLPIAKRRSLVRSVTNFLNPARKNRGTGIRVAGAPDIGPATISEYPTDSELAEVDDRRNLDLPGVTLDIRATDKDRRKDGWFARIVGDSRFKKRLPMNLYPTIDAERLAHLDSVTGNVILEGERQENGSFRPKRIHLLDFHEPADAHREDRQEEAPGGIPSSPRKRSDKEAPKSSSRDRDD